MWSSYSSPWPIWSNQNRHADQDGQMEIIKSKVQIETDHFAIVVQMPCVPHSLLKINPNTPWKLINHISKSGISSLNHIQTNYHEVIGRGQLKGSPNHKEIVFFGHCPNMIFRMGLPYRPPAENCASWFPFLRLSTPSNGSQVTTMKKVGIGTMPKQQKIRNINRRHLQTQWWALAVPHLRDSSTQPLIQHSLHRAIRT